MGALQSLLNTGRNLPSLKRVVQALSAAQHLHLLGLVSEAVPWWIAVLAQEVKPILVISPTPDRASDLHAELSQFTENSLFPAWDILPFDPMAPDSQLVQQRLDVILGTLEKPGRNVIVTSVKALMDPTLSREQLSRYLLRLQVADHIPPRFLMEQLLEAGYRPVHQVESPGTMAVRGGIVDVFPPNLTLPVRLEFLGDEIEEIRTFDPDTQRSVQRIQDVVFTPASEAPAMLHLQERLRMLDLSRCRPEVRDEWTASIQRILEGDLGTLEPSLRFAIMGSFASLLEYLPANTVILLDKAQQCYMVAQHIQTQATDRHQMLLREGELPGGLTLPIVSMEKWLKGIATRFSVAIGGWEALKPDLSVRLEPGELQPAPTIGQSWQALTRELDSAVTSGFTAVVASQHAQRITEILHESGIEAVLAKGHLPPAAAGHVYVTSTPLRAGWTSPMAGLLVLTDREILGESLRNTRATRRGSHGKEPWIDELVPGDYVVHVDHGIARFAGLTVMESNGSPREYLVLEYAEGDRLYVPTDQSHQVSRYLGPEGSTPTLTQLGSTEWARTTQRVKHAVQDLARELVQLYAARQLAEGFAYGPDMPWERELAESFPFVETPDQQRAIEEVLSDMQKPFPMDRLVCGDVGYGKTEVAVRAAFKAVSYGKQVAILVPTTILAQQHYHTFKDRLGPFPVRIEVLSRFRSQREQKKVLEDLARGSVDIVIGTHRLLQPDVRFRDLGLLIVDEEQRFGVRHKEKLKWLRLEVDVLTLAATPIPRTLYMSLVGVRDMSLITTPLPGRQPIKTYVLRYDEETVRGAIHRELQRGGQVFYVHNRVQTIHQAADRVLQLVPEARIAIAHGQLPEDELDKVMVDFVAGRYDVLVCTTIIEAGLDMPRVNTIIIEDADRFGLAQLYQLRGRVGRGSQRAYAYLFYDPCRPLAGRGAERLQAILEATELGSGFHLAMMDLEIRGAGNLLGAEQHGHLAAVGFSLYSQMLAEAVAELKGEMPTRSEPSVSIDLPVAAYLPTDYIESDLLRVNLYRRLAGLRSLEELAAFRDELVDRFGALPAPAENLIYLMKLKILSAETGVRSIRNTNGHLQLEIQRLRNYPQGLPGRLRYLDGLLEYLPAHPQSWKEELALLMEGLRG